MRKQLIDLKLGETFRLNGKNCKIANITTTTIHYWSGKTMIVAWRDKNEHLVFVD